MKLRKLLCMVMALAVTAATPVYGSAAPGSDLFGRAAVITEKKAAEPQGTLKEETEFSSDDISVKWKESHFYFETSLGRYKILPTYAVRGYEDVPFIRVSDYLDAVFEGKAEVFSADGLMKVSMNGTEAVIDPEKDTIYFENPSRFRSEGEIDGAILADEEVNVVTKSVKNKSTQTSAKALTVSLKDYQMPVITWEDDILMPFLALQNTFGAITWNNVMTYNGKDYYNVYSVNNYILDEELDPVKDHPYMNALYSGPFSRKDKTTEAYAEYGYYATCLLMDLTFGHKEEKKIITFDEYFTRINAKKSLSSTDPFAVISAEIVIFSYLFDSGHDAVTGIDTVFGRIENIEGAQTGKFVDDMKKTDEGQELLEDTIESGDESMEELGNVLIGALQEKGFKIPEIAPLLIWDLYLDSNRPEDYGDERLDYVDDTAVIYFNAFKNDMTRDPSYYLAPVKEEDAELSNFAFFYRCFEDIKKHSKVKNVVINLSDNGGGDATGLISVLGFLSKDGEVRLTDLDIVSGSYREECYHVDTNLDGIADSRDGYGGQYDFYIMTSRSSYSCANALPYFAQQAGLAKIIGSKPGGGDCVVGCFTDAYGYCGAFSGMLKLGKQDAKGFVSNEKATEVDFDMVPSILEYDKIPWFDAEGIAEAVRQYKSGKTRMTYDTGDTLEELADLLQELFK